MTAKAEALRIHVHEDTRVLDGMAALVELARAGDPLELTLCAMCRRISQIAGVDVVSVYLRERTATGEVLVMRGNVGFPPEAVGRVQLGRYEGLTGVVAERRRPVTVAVAQEDGRYKHVDGIGEDQFAAYLGVPLLVADEVAGVLVMQRRAPGTFGEPDIALASSLTAPCILAVEQHAARAGAGPGLFAGRCLVRGRAAGAAVVLPTVAARPVSAAAALHALEFDLAVAAQRLGHGTAGIARALENLGRVTIALREHVAAPAAEDVVSALDRVPYHASSGARDLDALFAERRREIRELWSFLVADMQHRLALDGAVLVVARLGTFVALEAVARGAVAVVVADAAESGARAVLETASIPAVGGVPELAAHLERGDRLEVDGAHGVVRIVLRA